jgi:CheY-like chemotaxis protein
VIALTAHGELPREWALTAGCAAYLKKPCYPHDLALEISAVLDKAGAYRPEPVPFRPCPEHPQVLVVDGNVGDRELFAEYLEYRGCVVSVSLSAAAALGDAQRLRPEVIVLDLDLPRQAGWEILRSLRRDPVVRGIPVVGLTRQATDGRREDARGLGAALLAKPCEPDALFLAVSKAAAPAPRSRLRRLSASAGVAGPCPDRPREWRCRASAIRSRMLDAVCWSGPSRNSVHSKPSSR